MSCYVCLEQCNPVQICACTHMFLHEECQKKLLKTTLQCTVCCEQYRNIVIKNKKRLTPAGRDLILVQLVSMTGISIMVMMLCFVFYWAILCWIVFFATVNIVFTVIILRCSTMWACERVPTIVVPTRTSIMERV